MHAGPRVIVVSRRMDHARELRWWSVGERMEAIGHRLGLAAASAVVSRWKEIGCRVVVRRDELSGNLCWLRELWWWEVVVWGWSGCFCHYLGQRKVERDVRRELDEGLRPARSSAF